MLAPLSPRVSERYAVSTWRPRLSHAMRALSSSSGCVPMISTRALEPIPAAVWRHDCAHSANGQRTAMAKARRNRMYYEDSCCAPGRKTHKSKLTRKRADRVSTTQPFQTPGCAADQAGNTGVNELNENARKLTNKPYS